MCGEFRLGVAPYLSEAALALPVDRLRSEFPQSTLRVASGWSPRLVEQVARSELDAAAVCLADGAGPPDGLAGDDLGAQAVLLVASPDLGVPKSARLCDLSCHPWVMNESGCRIPHVHSPQSPSGSASFSGRRRDAERRSQDVAGRARPGDRGRHAGRLRRKPVAGGGRGDRLAGFPSASPVMDAAPAAGRTARRPIAVFRDALIEALNAPA